MNNFFHGNGMFGPRIMGALGGSAPPGPRLGALDPTMRAFMDRVRAAVDRLGQYYQRNAALPLEFRVKGPDYSAAADLSDQLWKGYIVGYDQAPDAQWFNKPPDAQAIFALDELARRTGELEGRLATAAAAAKGGGAPPAPAPGPAPAPAPEAPAAAAAEVSIWPTLAVVGLVAVVIGVTIAD
jgi:hypothetical protein